MEAERNSIQRNGICSRERSVETANTTLDVAIEHVRAYVPDFLREIDLSRIRTLLPDENTALIALCITDQGSESFVMQRDCAIRTIETPAFTRSELRRLFAVLDTMGQLSVAGWEPICTNLRKTHQLLSFAGKKQSPMYLNTWESIC